MITIDMRTRRLAWSAGLALGLAAAGATAAPPDRDTPAGGTGTTTTRSTTTTTTTTADPPPPGRTAGQSLGDAVDRAAEGIRETADSLRAQFQKARSGVAAMGVQARLYSRLHWEKALADVDFDLEVRRDGTATLRGAVPDAAARKRALDLARETVGVTTVIDQLSLRPAPDGSAAPAASPTPTSESPGRTPRP